jgi:hypothetical protein
MCEFRTSLKGSHGRKREQSSQNHQRRTTKCDTILDIAGRIGLSCGTCHGILRKHLLMNVWHKSGKFVPRWLNDEQKQRQSLAAKSTTGVSPLPLYSPDLAPRVLLSKTKSELQGCHLQDVPELLQQLRKILCATPTSQFQRCCERWQKHWMHWETQKENTSSG